MKETVSFSLRRSLAIVAAAALFAACADDAPLAPVGGDAGSEARFADPAAGQAVAVTRDPQLALCPNLRTPVGSKLAAALYAEGVQIYSWNGTTWTFVAPDAELFASTNGQGQIGSHYAGPTWESISGSKVVGAVVDRCTPDPDAVPWLLLSAVSAAGPGIFRGVTYIQRVHTTGGNAPLQPGTSVGEEARVPYTADYLFYRGG